jgi:hypothetical protein
MRWFRAANRCETGACIAASDDLTGAEPMEEDNTAAPSPRLGQDASPVASIAGDMRDAWSCPLPNEVFEVGSQGQDEDIAGLGVAIALGKLLSVGCTPVRHVSHTSDSLPLCLSPH